MKILTLSGICWQNPNNSTRKSLPLFKKIGYDISCSWLFKIIFEISCDLYAICPYLFSRWHVSGCRIRNM